ncbi:serine protease inhibitor 42Dd-like isoform X2 [Arctopsyche grandis]
MANNKLWSTIQSLWIFLFLMTTVNSQGNYGYRNNNYDQNQDNTDYKPSPHRNTFKTQEERITFTGEDDNRQAVYDQQYGSNKTQPNHFQTQKRPTQFSSQPQSGGFENQPFGHQIQPVSSQYPSNQYSGQAQPVGYENPPQSGSQSQQGSFGQPQTNPLSGQTFDYQNRPQSIGFGNPSSSIPFGSQQTVPFGSQPQPSPSFGSQPQPSYQGQSQSGSETLLFSGSPKDLPTKEAITQFSLNMFKKVLKSSPQANVVLSPISVSTLLSLVQQASEGNTLTEFDVVLGQSKTSSKKSYRSIMDSIATQNGRNSISLANGMFINSGFKLDRTLRDTAKNFFSADIEQIDFKNTQRAAEAINRWVEKQTQGVIQNLVSPESIRRDSDCMLTNAFYFKGTWKIKFDPKRTKSMEFHTDPQNAVDVQYMLHNEKYLVNEDDAMGAKWLIMPFDGNKYSMVFVLPQKSHGLDAMIDRLSTADMLKMMTVGSKYKVAMSIPKFNFTYDTSLVNVLFEMGIREVFTPNSAATLFSTNRRAVTISSVIQKASISIDENGSVAAAGTNIGVNTLSLPPPNELFIFRAIEPFLTILVDNENQIPLVITKVYHPQ